MCTRWQLIHTISEKRERLDWRVFRKARPSLGVFEAKGFQFIRFLRHDITDRDNSVFCKKNITEQCQKKDGEIEAERPCVG